MFWVYGASAYAKPQRNLWPKGKGPTSWIVEAQQRYLKCHLSISYLEVLRVNTDKIYDCRKELGFKLEIY